MEAGSERILNPNSANPFTALPNGLIGKLEGYEWGVLFALKYHGLECYPSHRRIAQIAGISVSSTQRALESLKKKGIVSWESRVKEDGSQSSNLYTIHISSHDYVVDAPLPPLGHGDRPPSHGDRPPRSVGPTPPACGTDEQDLDEQDLDEQEEETPIPPLRPRRASVRGRRLPSRISPSEEQKLLEIRAKTMRIYNLNKPPKWSKKRVMTAPTAELVLYWIEELGESEFYEYLEKALKYITARKDPWWRETALSLEALIRKTKTHLIEFAEKYEDKSHEHEAEKSPAGSSRRYNTIDPSTLTDYESVFGG